MKKILSMLVISLLVLSMIFIAPMTHATGARIWTDKANYGPGETVTIFGSGFLASAEVTITIERPNKWLDTVYAVTDNVGGFISTYTLDGIEGTYAVTATDGTNTATTTFTDALTYTPDRYPPTGSASVAAGSSISFTLTLSDTVPKGGVTYTRKSLIAKTGWTHMDDAWVTTDPSSFTKPVGPFEQLVTVTITVPSDAVPDGYAAILKYTPREGSGCEIYITVTPAPVVTATVTFGQVGVGTDFTGTVLTVDGTDYWGVGGLPHTYTWNIGSSHTFAYGSPLDTGLGTQYVWTSTSGLSLAQSGSITVPSGGGSVTGYYNTQYYLTVTSPYDTPSGEGWYDKNTNAYAHLAAGTVVITPGWVKAVFTGWDVDASGANYAQSNPIYMNGPKTAVADWTIQYYLQVVSDPSLIPPMPGANWYDNCTHVTLTANAYYPSEAGVEGVRYRFSYWDVDGTPVSGNPIDVHMNTYHTATAHYVIQYYLTMSTNYGTVSPGNGWYDVGSVVAISATAPSVADGERYVWLGWTGTGTISYTGMDNPASVTMNSPIIQTASWRHEYRLTMNTNFGTTSPSVGEHWYTAGTVVDIEAFAPSVIPGERYVWNGWTGTGTISYTGTANPASVTMNSPIIQTASWTHQYYLTVQIDPSGLNPAPTPASDWHDEGTDVTETAASVTGYIFVYWDVDGGAVSGNPIHVHMDAPHTATAHYWLELGFEAFVTDSSFNAIDHFDTVFTPKDLRKTMFKLASTNPGQFYLNIKITNTWLVNTGPITVSYTLDDDFMLHPIQGDPIQVWTGYGITGTRIPAVVDTTARTVTISGIALGQTIYISLHMGYGPAKAYYTRAEMDGWKAAHEPNTFTAVYTVTVPGPFPFVYTSPVSSVTLPDPVVVLGVED